VEAIHAPFQQVQRFPNHPSITHPDMVVGVGFADVGSQDLLLGIYANPRLQGWILRNHGIEEICHLVENDLLFKGGDISFSTDYGVTWKVNVAGIRHCAHPELGDQSHDARQALHLPGKEWEARVVLLQ